MATFLQSSGAISLNDINTVFGRGTNLNAYRGTTYYTASGGPYTFSSGTINMSDFYGTGPSGAAFNATISSNNDQLNLRSWALANGWNGSTPAVITLASGYYLYSTNTGGAGLTIDGSWPGGVTFVNNGYVMGCGGNGGGGAYNQNGPIYGTTYAPGNGGTAISLGTSCTITNNSYIGGGGGGGGGGVKDTYYSTGTFGGGGAGGGIGGRFEAPPGTVVAAGGVAGGIGGAGGNGNTGAWANTFNGHTIASGGGGGRIMPGTRTATPTATENGNYAYGGYGAEANVGGGSASYSGTSTATGTNIIPGYGGQAGGSGDAVATSAYATSYITSGGGGGGGWGASGGTSGGAYPYGAGIPSYGGGSGGNCVSLNGYSVTWSATGNRYGAIV